MSLLLRLLIAVLVAGALAGWGLRRALRDAAPATRERAVVLLALLPFALHALDTALRVAPRGGAAAAAGYAVAAVAIGTAGGVFAWRWRRGMRLAFAPLALSAAALPASWVLGAALRRAGETTDAIPLLVYLGFSVAVATALAVAQLRRPGGGGAPGGAAARRAGGVLREVVRRLRRGERN